MEVELQSIEPSPVGFLQADNVITGYNGHDCTRCINRASLRRFVPEVHFLAC